MNAGARALATVAGVAVLLFAARLGLLAHLADQGVGLHVDEAQYWDWSRSLQWGFYSKPPMIAALIAASTALAGDGVVALKLLVLACYPLTSLAVYGLGRELGGPRAGLIAALLFAVTPLALLLGLAATTDAPLLLAWALALWMLWRLMRAPSAVHAVLLGLCCGLGLLSKYTMAAFAFSALGLALSAWRQGRLQPAHLRALALAAAVATLLLLPHLAWNAAHGWPTLHHTAEITADAHAAPGAARAFARAGGFALAQLVVAGPVAAVWALYLAWRRRADGAGDGDRLAGPLLFWASVPLFGVGVLQAWHAGAEVNWAAPALLGALLWLGCRAARSPNWGRVLAACVLLQVLVCGAVALASDLAQAAGQSLPRRLDVWSRMRGWQEGFEQLRPAAAAHEGATLVAADRALLAQSRYAWRELPLEWAAWSAAGGPARSHYQLQHPLPAGAGDQRPVLLLAAEPLSPALQARFAQRRLLGRAAFSLSAGRSTEVGLWEASTGATP